jgi:dolichol-phosphate mannosyltransferase
VNADKVAVIVPAYCEELLIARTITGLPDIVGEIIVVDDASTDATVEQALKVGDPRIQVIRHEKNSGVGAAIYTGYQAALQGTCSAFVVLAGDNQMDHADLERVAGPVLNGSFDYVKGNRLLHERASDMPLLRRLGTRSLAWCTSLACGLRIGDSQCGYTAISRRALNTLDLNDLWKGYGYPNDLLIALAARGQRIAECPVRPVYGSEKSGLRFWHMASILGVIGRRALREGSPPRRSLRRAQVEL